MADTWDTGSDWWSDPTIDWDTYSWDTGAVDDYTIPGSGADMSWDFDIGDVDGVNIADMSTDEILNLADTSPSFLDSLTKAVPGLLKTFGNTAAKTIFNEGDASKGLNIAGIATLLGGAYSMFGGGSDIQVGGYNEPVPKLTAVREAVNYAPDPNRRPGAGGRRYFTDPEYVNQASETYADDLAAARQRAQDQASTFRANAPTYTAPAAPTTTVATPWNAPASDFRTATPSQALPRQEAAAPMASIDPSTGGLKMAAGGQVPKFRGDLETNGFVLPGDVVAHADPMGQANKERGLRALHQNIGVEAIRGPGDAMSDSIPATIDGQEPARVANGEAYVPRQNVARMGNGDTDEGANRLREIMNNLRKQRTGSTEQINPDNPQELRAAYGGQVRKFSNGDAITPVSYGTSTSSSLSPWAGEYVTNMLGQAQAAAAQPYQAYQGPLTAGASDLQQQAFAGASSMANTGFTPTQFTGGLFDTQAAQQYMNPYLSAALDPQMKELARQAGIQQLQDRTALTKAGAFGGGRQAIMQAENTRNLLDKQQQALAQGYSTAYDKAMAQFNADQTRQMDAQKATEASRQYSADFGRQSLADLAKLGETQRAIEAEGIAADKAQFEEERGWAYQMPQYLKDLLGANLPVGTESTIPNQTGLSSILSQVGQLGGLYTSIDDALKKLGQTTTTPTTTTPTTGT